MSGNILWSTKVDEKLHSDLVILSISFSNITLNFKESIRVELLKYLMCFFNVFKWITNEWNISEEKYFAPLRILNLWIKPFVNPFLFFFFYIYCFDFFDSSFTLFLFKSVLFTKSEISCLFAKYTCVNLAVKVIDITLLILG